MHLTKKIAALTFKSLEFLSSLVSYIQYSYIVSYGFGSFLRGGFKEREGSTLITTSIYRLYRSSMPSSLWESISPAGLIEAYIPVVMKCC